MTKILLNLAIIPMVFIAVNIESKGYTLLFLAICVFIISYFNDKSNFNRKVTRK